MSAVILPTAVPSHLPPHVEDDEAAEHVRQAALAAAEERFRRNVTTLSLVCLLTLSCFYTLFVAREIFMPLAMAVILKLLLNPGVRAMAKLGVPAPAGAGVMLFLFIGVLTTIFILVAAPASEWVGRAPQWLPVLQAKLKVLAGPVTHVQQAMDEITKALSNGSPNPAETVALTGTSLTEFLFSGTRSALTLAATMLLLLYFLLAAGDIFLRRLVEVLPRLTDKKRAVEMTRQVEKDISTYLVTITLINAGLGVCTGVALLALGMPDPLLWGVLAFALNFLPYVGPALGIGVLTIAGLMSFDSVQYALLAPGLYLALVVLEGQFLTPIVLARRLTLNPVALFLALVLWGFLWGIPGALLAVPLLAVFKILCDHVRPLAAVGHFLGD